MPKMWVRYHCFLHYFDERNFFVLIQFRISCSFWLWHQLYYRLHNNPRWNLKEVGYTTKTLCVGVSDCVLSTLDWPFIGILIVGCHCTMLTNRIVCLNPKPRISWLKVDFVSLLSFYNLIAKQGLGKYYKTACYVGSCKPQCTCWKLLVS